MGGRIREHGEIQHSLRCQSVVRRRHSIRSTCPEYGVSKYSSIVGREKCVASGIPNDKIRPLFGFGFAHTNYFRFSHERAYGTKGNVVSRRDDSALSLMKCNCL